MRFLLLLLSLVLQLNTSGFANHNPQENHAQKTLNSETFDCNERSYELFRYYDCDSGSYISKDLIGIKGGIGLYAYVHDPNSWVDVFGLECGQVKPDKSWKNKIVGRAQKTKAPEHRVATLRKAIKAAKNPNVKKVYMYRGYNSIFGHKTISPNRRSDVLIEYHNDKIYAIEIASKTDNPQFLNSRNFDAMLQFPNTHTPGNIDVQTHLQK